MTEQWSHDDLFAWFIVQQQHLAWIHLGKVANPVNGEVSRDLQAAKLAIDLLGMMETKTRGNLSAEEERLLGQVLSTLRLNYVEESQRPEPPRDEESTQEDSDGGTGQKAGEETGTRRGTDDESKIEEG